MYSFIFIFLFFVCFAERHCLYSLAWSLIHPIGEARFELLILQSLLPKCWAYRYTPLCLEK